MAFRVGFDDVVIDTAGNALSNVEVSVYKVGTTELQTIYNERVGGSTKANPFTTTSNGRVSFYIESPQFDVAVKDLNVPERFTARTITIDRVPGGGTSAQILVSNASGLYVPATLSGDATISNTGVLTIGSSKIESKHVKDGTISDTDLESPNNSAYRFVFSAGLGMVEDQAAGTYLMSNSELDKPVVSGGSVISGDGTMRAINFFFYFDDADYTVAGKTQKLRLRTQVATNATKAAIKYTFGMYPITVAGSGDNLTITMGTIVSGSTVEINEPAASTIASAVSSDFTVPADGAYVLAVNTSATLTNLSAAYLAAQLQTRSV